MKFSYYNKSCYNNILNNLNSLSNYTAKNLKDIIDYLKILLNK